MEARQRRLQAAEPALEGPHHAHVAIEHTGQHLGDPLRTRVAVRAGRDPRERAVEQLAKALHEPPVPLAVEVGDEVLALLVALGAARREQAVEVAGTFRRQRVQVVLRLLLEHVQVAHGAEHPPGAPQALERRAQLGAVEVVVEHTQRHAHAARGLPHHVQLLGVLAEARALLVLEHALQVEGEGLDGRLHHGVRGQDAGRLFLSACWSCPGSVAVFPAPAAAP